MTEIEWWKKSIQTSPKCSFSSLEHQSWIWNQHENAHNTYIWSQCSWFSNLPLWTQQYWTTWCGSAIIHEQNCHFQFSTHTQFFSERIYQASSKNNEISKFSKTQPSLILWFTQDTPFQSSEVVLGSFYWFWFPPKVFQNWIYAFTKAFRK